MRFENRQQPHDPAANSFPFGIGPVAQDKAGVITCLLAVGLERILPTLIKASGGKVVDAATLKPPK